MPRPETLGNMNMLDYNTLDLIIIFCLSLAVCGVALFRPQYAEGIEAMCWSITAFALLFFSNLVLACAAAFPWITIRSVFGATVSVWALVQVLAATWVLAALFRLSEIQALGIFMIALYRFLDRSDVQATAYQPGWLLHPWFKRLRPSDGR